MDLIRFKSREGNGMLREDKGRVEPPASYLGLKIDTNLFLNVVLLIISRDVSITSDLCFWKVVLCILMSSWPPVHVEGIFLPMELMSILWHPMHPLQN